MRLRPDCYTEIRTIHQRGSGWAPVGSTDFNSDGPGPSVGTVGSTPSRSRHTTRATLFREYSLSPHSGNLHLSCAQRLYMDDAASQFSYPSPFPASSLQCLPHPWLVTFLFRHSICATIFRQPATPKSDWRHRRHLRLKKCSVPYAVVTCHSYLPSSSE